MNIVLALVIVVLSFILISYILDDYMCCIRLNRAVCSIINNADMSDLCKLENLSFLHKSCIRNAENTVFFKHHYLSIADKIDDSINRINAVL